MLKLAWNAGLTEEAPLATETVSITLAPAGPLAMRIWPGVANAFVPNS